MSDLPSSKLTVWNFKNFFSSSSTYSSRCSLKKQAKCYQHSLYFCMYTRTSTQTIFTNLIFRSTSYFLFTCYLLPEAQQRISKPQPPISLYLKFFVKCRSAQALMWSSQRFFSLPLPPPLTTSTPPDNHVARPDKLAVCSCHFSQQGSMGSNRIFDSPSFVMWFLNEIPNSLL